MATIALISPQPLSGKTTIAAVLAHMGGGASLKRAGSDENAAADARLFESLSAAGARHTIIEFPAGETSTETGAKIVVIAPGNWPADEVARFCEQGGQVAGVIANRVPAKREKALREAYAAAGLDLLAAVPEDRVLAAPLLRDVVAALEAEASHVSNGDGGAVIDNPVVASIASDPGQGYFLRENPSAVIVRSDKPDLQLSAINAGAPALIVTGSMPILHYVLERAESDEIPFLSTLLDTVQTVTAIEDLFGAKPFPGGETKTRRIAELLADSGVASLLS